MQIAQKDVYMWSVAYRDGTSTHEYDDARPDGRGFAEREEKPVQTITLARVEDKAKVTSVAVPEGAEPLFFRRRARLINSNTGDILQSGTTHCVGWKCGDEVAYLFVFDDGTTLLTKNLQAV